MRIIGGQYRGKKLFSPVSDKVRPTSDKARESLFNILSAQLEYPWSKYCLLDVFSGSGAIGLEALSRGAAAVTLIDIDTATAARNAKLFAAAPLQLKLLKADATKLPPADRTYDIVFLDAPYHLGLSENALISLKQQKWLKNNGLVIVETAKDEDLPLPPGFLPTDTRCYGIAKFTFLRFVQ